MNRKWLPEVAHAVNDPQVNKQKLATVLIVDRAISIPVHMQLTPEQLGFELHRSTYTWIVFQ